MSAEPKLPEIERGTEVFAVDPLTIRAHFEVDDAVEMPPAGAT